MIEKYGIACALITLSLAACAGDKTLQGVFEAQMKDNGSDGWDIIHVQENETDGFVLHTAWTDQNPDSRNEPGVNYFQKQGTEWRSAMGTACSNSGVSMFGLMGNGYLYCSVLRPDMSFENVAAGGHAAQVFTFNETMKVWVAVTSEANAKVVGISKDGREIALN
jgi:hypothetical protein